MDALQLAICFLQLAVSLLRQPVSFLEFAILVQPLPMRFFDISARRLEQPIGLQVRLFDLTWNGTHIDKSRIANGVEGGGRIVVRARVGAGQVEVLHAAA